MELPLTALLLAMAGVATARFAPAADSSNAVRFATDVAPILAAKCVTCHQAEKSKGGYQLHTFASLVKAGRSKEIPVRPGLPEESPLVRLIEAKDPDDRMPQDADPLSASEIALIRRWILEGAAPGDIDPSAHLSTLAPAKRRPAPPATYSRPVPVLALVFSPDGTEIAMGGYHEILVRETGSGQLLRRIPNIARQVQQLAYSPDGRWLAVAAGTPGRDGEVILLESGTGERIHLLASAGDLMIAANFSPDGRRLAAAGSDGAVRGFEVATGKEWFRSEQNADWVMGLAWSPDGKRFLTMSRDKTARIVDADNGELEQTYANHGNAVFSGVILDDNRRALTAGRDPTIHLWQIAEAKKLAESPPLPAEVTRMVADDDQVLAGLSNGEIIEHRVHEKKIERTKSWGIHGDTVSALAWHPGSRRVASAGHDGRIRLWSAATGKLEKEFPAFP